MVQIHSAPPSPPSSPTGDGEGSHSDDQQQLPSSERRAMPLQRAIVRHLMMKRTSSQTSSQPPLSVQHLMEILLRNLDRRPTNTAHVGNNNPPPPQEQQPENRPTVYNLAFTQSQIALARPFVAGRGYARNLWVRNVELMRTMMNPDGSDHFGRYAYRGNGVYATPPIVVPVRTPPHAAPTINVRYFDPQPFSFGIPPRQNYPSPRPTTFAQRRYDPVDVPPGFPRQNEGSSFNNPAPPAPPNEQPNQDATKKYGCKLCKGVYDTPQKYAAHFEGKHYRYEDAETKALRRSLKAKKRYRERTRELCPAQSVEGLTMVPTEIESESSTLTRYKNNSGGSGGGVRNQVDNRIGSVSVKQEPV